MKITFTAKELEVVDDLLRKIDYSAEKFGATYNDPTILINSDYLIITLSKISKASNNFMGKIYLKKVKDTVDTFLNSMPKGVFHKKQ